MKNAVIFSIPQSVICGLSKNFILCIFPTDKVRERSAGIEGIFSLLLESSPLKNPCKSLPKDIVNTLQRELGVWGAMMMGLGSILGTGVFVSVNMATAVTGPSVVLAIALAALVATLNGLSSAQLAANHPVSGGTYEYGYRWLTPTLGFVAGYMFLCAKSASAATAALGFTGYGLHFLGMNRPEWMVPVAAVTVIAVTLLVLSGIRRSNITNIVIVSITLISLVLFVLLGLPHAIQNARGNLSPRGSPLKEGVMFA